MLNWVEHEKKFYNLGACSFNLFLSSTAPDASGLEMRLETQTTR